MENAELELLSTRQVRKGKLKQLARKKNTFLNKWKLLQQLKPNFEQ